MPYRREIDGLRAIAVLPVILAHAGLSVFSGGFVGVDVFFVISGFLISGLLYEEIIVGRFSLLLFYERRVRRIIPPLIPVVVVSFIVAYYTMLGDAFENFAQSVVATLLFSNNVLLTLTSGYWDLASDFKPLLHTWSLGVEEQFYIVYPLCAFLVVRWRRGSLPIVLGLGIAISFAMSVALTPTDPRASFYLIHTRAWELLLGALAGSAFGWFRASSQAANVLAFSGLAMILGAVLTFNNALPYPSYWAAIPCAGTALILLFAGPGTVVNRLLCLQPLVGIGLISYSAYLWHQPLFAFARILSIEPPGPWTMTALSVVTLGIAYLSWRYIEQPFRNRAHISRFQVFAGAAAVAGVLVAAGLAVSGLDGLPGRAPGMGLPPGRYIAYNERVFRYKAGGFSDANKPHLLVLGNSTGRDLVNVLLESGRFNRFEIVYRDEISACSDGRRSAADDIFNEADAVLMAANWTYDANCTGIDVDGPLLANKPFILVGPKHFGYNLNAFMHVPVGERAAVRATLLPDTVQSDQEFRALVPAGDYVDLLQTMQAKFGGIPVFDEEGEILSADRVHLTMAGAKFFSTFVFDDPAWARLFALKRRSATAPTP